MFNRHRYLNNSRINIGNIENSEFIQHSRQNLLSNLEPLNIQAKNILVIEHGKIITHALKSVNNNVTTFDDEELLYDYQSAEKFDLIIFPFAMHFTNDIQHFLHSCHQNLTQNGLLLVNFAAGGSLDKLRQYLWSLSSKFNIPYYQHIAPQIKFDDIAPLLKQAGFEENIAYMDKIQLGADTCLDFMRLLKQIGQNNMLSNISYISRNMYFELKNNVEPFEDIINLVSFVASKKRTNIKLKDQYFQN